MKLNKLSKDEERIVLECLKATVEGPFFPDREFHTLFGMERNEIARIMDMWPHVNKLDEKVNLAINNSIINLLGYPHKCGNFWSQFISVPPSDLKELFKRLKQ